MQMPIHHRRAITWERVLIVALLCLLALLSQAHRSVAYEKGITGVDRVLLGSSRSEPPTTMRPIPTLSTMLLSLSLIAQRPELRENAVVRDSVSAALQRELAEGLFANAIAAGELKGNMVMDMVIDEKGRVETVFTSAFTVSKEWKNIIQDQWMGHRFDIKLPKGHKEKVTIELDFP